MLMIYYCLEKLSETILFVSVTDLDVSVFQKTDVGI